jgi:AcrR family transcriptional regulator
MGRTREHDDATAQALLDAAEEIVERAGVEALSLRSVAAAANTTTRAVYSLFGSKSGLVAALGAHAFDLLGLGVEGLPWTDDPVADLVEAGLVFRAFASDHPSLFQIAVQHSDVAPELAARFRQSAQIAFAHLESRVARLEEHELLGGRSVLHAACQFHALCEGLAALELRGVFITGPDARRFWREALFALLHGFAVPVTADE